MPFVKLDCGMIHSSIWPDKDARDLFITALLMAEPIHLEEPLAQISVTSLKLAGWEVPPGWYGIVRAAGVGIINAAGVQHEQGILALHRLGQPEAHSRTPDFDGRRLVRVDGGFIVLNFYRYRDRDYTNKERQQRFREKRKGNINNGVTPLRNGVTRAKVTQAEAEAEAYSVPTERHTPGKAGGKIEFLVNPTEDNGSSTWKPSRIILSDLQSAFGRKIDVRAQLHSAMIWCRANERKRPTSAGMENFLRKWMVREVEKLPSSAARSRAEQRRDAIAKRLDES